MRCDLHVHTLYSGMCSVPVLNRICRESYNDPLDVYEILKRRGMDLVTITDHDSIGASEPLRRYPDFFLSEEVSCRTPDGTRLHVGVYDIQERHHIELQRRHEDLLSLIFYMQEHRLLFSVNHVFSSLTGRRTLSDFVLFEHYFPAIETRNGLMPRTGNTASAALAEHWGKPALAGSDAHTRSPLGLTYTLVPGARGKAEFLEKLRQGYGLAHGESGGYGKLTRAVLEIGTALLRDNPWTLALTPLLSLVPVITLVNRVAEEYFARKWARKLLPVSAPDGGRRLELEASQVNPRVPGGVLDEYQ